jgi:hypothetical protein
MKAALLALTVTIGFAAGAAAQEKDKKEDKAAKLAKAIDEIAGGRVIWCQAVH